MDKKSAALISAICIMLCISTAVAYNTWFVGKEHTAALGREQIEEEMSLASIAVNMDAQVINGGCQDMWVRAKIQPSDTDIKEAAQQEQLLCELVSDNITAHATQEDIQAGVWIPAQDGYYYYSKPVPPGEQSKPLFQSVKGQAAGPETNESQKERRIQVQAEGIQVNWIRKLAENGQEAFEQFCRQGALEEYRGIFV
ncbi:MAG: hypothetical protein HFE76_12370 [Firmicutes bacterium]|nr:hypothetical protein [Bacillota bacterium]